MGFWQSIFGTAERTNDTISDAVAEAVERVLREHAELTSQELQSFKKISDLHKKIEEYERRLSDLKIKTAEKEREIDHKLGLHQMRVEHERELAEDSLEAQEERLEKLYEVSVREAKVAAKEEAMAEYQRQMNDALARAERMVSILVEALPKAEIIANLTNENTSKKGK